MDEFFDQFFPTEFLIEYLENGPEENMDRFQTYVVYRFLTFAAKENPAVITELRDTLECPLSMDNLSDIYRFLDQDFYFSPSFSENSFDPVLLCYAIARDIKHTVMRICQIFTHLKQQCGLSDSRITAHQHQ